MHSFRWVGALAVGWVASLGWANAVDVSVTRRVQMGQGLPTLHVHIRDELAGFRVNLVRSDGKTFNFKGGGSPGVTRNIELSQPEGAFSYTGELIGVFRDGTSSTMPLNFETQLFGPLRIEFTPEGVDLEKPSVTFKISRPAKKAHVSVLMESGHVAFDGDIPFAEEPAQTPLVVSWPKAEGRVLKISVQAYDLYDFFNGFEVFPWQIDIPHEEVNFESGKWSIPSEEQAKLDGSLKLIEDAVTRYGRWAPVKLYVLGHTDTVGSAVSNRKLSMQRAQSIAAYFRKRGLKVPIFFEGFGEDALRVATEDETDEVRNRRAEYVVSVEAPKLQRAPTAPKWQKL